MSVDESDDCGWTTWVWMKKMNVNKKNKEKNVGEKDRCEWKN